MKYIQPTKKGRGMPAEINIIDVSADDLRPQTTDWLKTITDTVNLHEYYLSPEFHGGPLESRSLVSIDIN